MQIISACTIHFFHSLSFALYLYRKEGKKQQNAALRDALNSNELQFVFTSLSIAVFLRYSWFSWNVFLIFRFIPYFSAFSYETNYLNTRMRREGERRDGKVKWMLLLAHKICLVWKVRKQKRSLKSNHGAVDEHCKTIPNEENGYLVAINSIISLLHTIRCVSSFFQGISTLQAHECVSLFFFYSG